MKTQELLEEDITAEIEGVAMELALIGAFFEDGAEQGIDYPTRPVLKQAFFAIQSHLRRIAADLDTLSKNKSD